MKSALTSALADSGSDQAKPTRPPTAKVVSKSLLEDAAFPCLRYATGDVVVATEASNGHEQPETTTYQAVGTARMATSVSGVMADYELNPFKRRGGEEIISSSFASLQRDASLKFGSVQSNLITPSVYGSMPAGLTLDEKKSIIQATPMSPSLNLLNELGLGKVSHRTREAKQLRRHVLRGAVVIFVTAGYSGKRFIFERCKELGLRTVILDGPDSWSQSLVAEGVVEKFVPVDFADSETLFERLVAACKKVRNDLGDLDGIVTFCELAVPLAARLAEHLGVPGNTPEAVDTARDKHAARQCMQAAGLPTPKHFLIEGTDDVAAAADHVGFPAVIKPISGAASIGVIRVDDLERLKTAYARVVKDLKGAKVVAGALVEGDGAEDSEGNAGSWFDLKIMMEEYLDGAEVDVDLVLSDGAAVYGCITDNWPTVEPYFNETGSNCPSVLPRGQQVELMELAIKSVQCMGFKMGVFHVELKYTSRGPRLIEVNARMGGGPVRDTNLLVWGVDLVEEHVTACCGIPCKPAVAQTPINELAEYSVNAKVTGILEHADYMKKYEAQEGVLYARPLVEPGHHCVSVQDGLPTWVAEVMVSMAPVSKAIEWIQKMEEEVTALLPITPKPVSAR